MRKLILAVAIAASLPFTAIALTKSLTLAAPATYKAPGFKSITVLYSPEGDQTCMVTSACARDASSGLEGDCREHRLCSSSPPASITNLLSFAVAQWTTAAGY